jgi:glycosyltransferase involved in cell wall biosynthesis
MPLKVLQLSQYPIHPRISGGQRRAGAIHDGYRRAGVDACYAIIFDPNAYPAAVGTPGSYVVGPSTMSAVAANPLLIDVVIGELFDLDPVCAKPLLRFWNRFQPDVVQLEHCYLWPGVKRLFDTGQVRRVPVVYSSHNYETAMKQAIYARFASAEEREASIAKVRAAEEDLTRTADLTVTVSASDREVALAMGARRCVVVRNGSDRIVAKEAELQHWRARLFAERKSSFVLFVSSNHLPNYVGFQELAGTYLSYLPPDACIAVAGGIGTFMAAQPAFRSSMLLNRSRLLILGTGLSDADLAALVQMSSAILLPITDGGGSNIKTVEALLSGRPTIATRFAFRSYEEFQSLPQVILCDTAAEFQRAIQTAILAPHAAPAAADPRLEEVTWPRLGDAFARLVLEQCAKFKTLMAA